MQDRENAGAGRSVDPVTLQGFSDMMRELLDARACAAPEPPPPLATPPSTEKRSASEVA